MTNCSEASAVPMMLCVRGLLRDPQKVAVVWTRHHRGSQIGKNGGQTMGFGVQGHLI